MSFNVIVFLWHHKGCSIQQIQSKAAVSVNTCSNVRHGRLIRLVKQPPSVRVSSTFVNLRIMSSTSVRLCVNCSEVQQSSSVQKKQLVNRPPPARKIHPPSAQIVLLAINRQKASQAYKLIWNLSKNFQMTICIPNEKHCMK